MKTEKILTETNKERLTSFGVDFEDILQKFQSDNFFLTTIFKKYLNISNRYLTGRIVDELQTKKEIDSLTLDLWKLAANKECEKLGKIPAIYYLKKLLSKEFRENKKLIDHILDELRDPSSGLEKDEISERYKKIYEISRKLNNLPINTNPIIAIFTIIMVILMIIGLFFQFKGS